MPPNRPAPAEEFWIAFVGPVTSLALAALCWEIEPFLSRGPALALARYLAWLNLILALFNLVPGFPLDGGRVFRAIVWRVTHDYHRATVAAGIAGRFFGFVLIFWGVWQALMGNIGGGIWIAIIGWFLESAAGSQMQMETVRTALGGHRVLDAMQRNFVQVPGQVTLQELIDRGLAPTGSRFAIVTGGRGRRAGYARGHPRSLTLRMAHHHGRADHGSVSKADHHPAQCRVVVGAGENGAGWRQPDSGSRSRRSGRRPFARRHSALPFRPAGAVGVKPAEASFGDLGRK